MSICDTCPFKGNQKIPYILNKNSNCFVISETPQNLNLLKNILKEVEIDLDRVSFLNVISCKINKKQVSIDDTKQGIDICKEYLLKAITTLKPRLIVTLGKTPTQIISGLQKINENRGRFFPILLDQGRKSFGKINTESSINDFMLLPTVSLEYVLKQAREIWQDLPYVERTPIEKIMYDDFKLVKSFLITRKPYSINTDEYVFIKDEDLKDLNSKIISFDLETTDTKIHSKSCELLCLSLTNKEGRAFVIKREDFGENLKNILEQESIKFVANRPFDEVVLEKNGIKVNGLVLDVLTMAHLLNENYNINLENITNAYTDLRNIKDLSEGMRFNLKQAKDEVLVKYSGVDADATYRCGKALISEISKDKKLLNYLIKFIIPIQNTLAEINKNGVLIDIEKLKKNEESLSYTMDTVEKDAINLISPLIRIMHKDKGLKLSRNDLVSDYLFRHKSGLNLTPKYFTSKTKEPAITEAHLKLFSNKPFVSLYMRWKKAQKILNTYFPQLWNNLYEDNRIYPNIILYRTTTGRTVMLNPAIQTFPKRGEFATYIRECIIPDRGWIIGERDLSQSELRIMGWLAGDKAILDALHNKIDLHTKTASIINNVEIDKVTKDMRDKAKPVNFGFLYGMSAKSFRQYAKDEYNIDFSEDECFIIRSKFFQEYKSLQNYYEKILKFARNNGYVRGILGRKRNLPLINSSDDFQRSESERQAINFQTQNFSSDLGLLGMYLFLEKIKKYNLENSIKPFWFIHDAIMFQAKKEVFNDAMDMLKDCLENETKTYVKENWGIDINYPIESEGKFSETNWAEMQKFKD